MQQHTKNYFEHFDLAGADTIICEIPDCGKVAVDIHHIIPRSRFGKKRKDEQDHVSNLIALCRDCHDKAHNHTISIEDLKHIVKNR